MTVVHYRHLLMQIADYLETYGVKLWVSTLRHWAEDLDSDSVDLKSHLERTRRNLGGMESIGDIVITPKAGDLIANDSKQIKKANDALCDMISQLSDEIEQQLRRY